MHSLSTRRYSRRGVIRTAALTVPLAGFVLLTACGDEGDESHTVDMIDMRYEPADLTISVGTTVTWKNVSDFVHTVTTDPTLLQDASLVTSPEGQQFNSGNIQPGESWARTFDKPGEFRYACIPHEMAGMVARLVVES